jgi:hypothetical protein
MLTLSTKALYMILFVCLDNCFHASECSSFITLFLCPIWLLILSSFPHHPPTTVPKYLHEDTAFIVQSPSNGISCLWPPSSIYMVFSLLISRPHFSSLPWASSVFVPHLHHLCHINLICKIKVLIVHQNLLLYFDCVIWQHVEHILCSKLKHLPSFWKPFP